MGMGRLVLLDKYEIVENKSKLNYFLNSKII